MAPGQVDWCVADPRVLGVGCTMMVWLHAALVGLWLGMCGWPLRDMALWRLLAGWTWPCSPQTGCSVAMILSSLLLPEKPCSCTHWACSDFQGSKG